MEMVAPITEDLMRSIGAQIVNTYLDLDGGAGNQCWDSAMWINEKFFGLPRINTWNPPGKSGRWPGWAGNLVDCFPQTDSIAAAYELKPPGTLGLPGDTYVWGTDNQLWYPKTHVATLVVDLGNGWGQFLSQNSSTGRPELPGYSPDSTGPVIFQTLPFEGLIGIIRPRVGGTINVASADTQPIPAPEEEDEKMLIIATAPEEGGNIWIGDGVTRRLIPNPFILDAYQKCASWGIFKIFKDGAVQTLPADALGADVTNTVNRFTQAIASERTATIVAEVRAHTAVNADRVLDVLKTLPGVPADLVEKFKADLADAANATAEAVKASLSNVEVTLSVSTQEPVKP